VISFNCFWWSWFDGGDHWCWIWFDSGDHFSWSWLVCSSLLICFDSSFYLSRTWLGDSSMHLGSWAFCTNWSFRWNFDRCNWFCWCSRLSSMTSSHWFFLVPQFNFSN
jgi:hypothetical protein